MLEPHLASGSQTEKLPRRILAEIVPVDVELARERQHPCAGGLILGIVDRLDLFHLSFRIVFDDDLERFEHRHDPRSALVELFAQQMLEQREVENAVGLRHPNVAAKTPNCRRAVTAAAHSREGRHARIIPAGDVALVYQPKKSPFRHNGVVEVEPGKLDLFGPIGGRPQRFEKPIVERAMVFKLERTDGVGNSFDPVRLPVCPIVGRIDAPLVTSALMVGVANAVHDRVSQVEIGGSHIDFGPEHV